MIRQRLVSALFALSLLAGPARAGDWPCWRGPGGQGISDVKDLPLTWGGKANENVLWKMALPGGDGKSRLDLNQSSPIVCKDRVIVCMVFWPAGVTQKEFPEHHVACYQAADGKLLWDTVVPPGPWLLTDLRGGYSAPTPTSDGERIYVLFGSSVLAALDFAGKIVWRREIGPFAWDVAIGTSPFLYEDTVLVLADQAKSNLSRLLAFDKKTGDLKWEQKRPGASFSHSTPLLIQVQGKPQLVIASSNALQGLEPGNGKVIWWADHKGDVPTPVFAAGMVYSEDGRGGPGIAVDPSGAGNVSKSHVKWRTPPIPEGYSSPLVAAGCVYRINNPGVLRCWQLDSGEALYSERLPQGVSAAASPIATADGRIYLASAGKSLVIRSGPKFEVLANNDLGESSPASPAVANGRIYLKGSRHLFCIGK